jgi:hypothetical protein
VPERTVSPPSRPWGYHGRLFKRGHGPPPCRQSFVPGVWPDTQAAIVEQGKLARRAVFRARWEHWPRRRSGIESKTRAASGGRLFWAVITRCPGCTNPTLHGLPEGTEQDRGEPRVQRKGLALAGLCRCFMKAGNKAELPAAGRGSFPRGRGHILGVRRLFSSVPAASPSGRWPRCCKAK